MTAHRERLPNRRASITFDFESQGLKFTATYSRGADGSVQEIFLRNHKASSMAGINASDASVVWSIARQHGVPFEVLRKALMRNADGSGSGPLARCLDIISERES
jgi:hypothetical protein